MSLLDNLLSANAFTRSLPTEASLSSLLGSFAPLVAEAPGSDPLVDDTSTQLSGYGWLPPPPPRRQRNPLAGLSRGLTPQFVGMLSRRRELRESNLYPAMFKGAK